MKFKILAATITILFFISASVQASPTLIKSDRGKDVTILQEKLYLTGYAITEIDGILETKLNEPYKPSKKITK